MSGTLTNSGSEMSSVLVAVRVRPLSSKESSTILRDDLLLADSGTMPIISADRTTITMVDPSSLASQGANPTMLSAGSSNNSSKYSFSFDRVFACSSAMSSLGGGPLDGDTQEDVFRYFGPILTSQVLQGFNSCLFAYGQTGSGKTYSMIGGMTNPGDLVLPAAALPSQCGLIPRICSELFDRMKAERQLEPSVTHRVEISFIEIYCEKVRDLLPSVVGKEAATKEVVLRVRQHPTRGPYVEGAQIVAVSDAASVMRLVALGMKDRATAETKMNEQSSRSHAILQLHVTRVEVAREASAVVTKTRSSKVSLVDLAGSERVNQSGATGDRLEEAKNINLSLHSLGRVIQILADRPTSCFAQQQQQRGGTSNNNAHAAGGPQCSSTAIPAYRDSVLTWLLSDCLGGNSKTMMLATISPSLQCFTQSLGTLRFACIAKKVVNVATVNEDSHFHKLISDLREQILRLTVQLEAKDEVKRHESAGANMLQSSGGQPQRRQEEETERLQRRIDELEKANKELTTRLDNTTGVVEMASRLRLEAHHKDRTLREKEEQIAQLNATIERQKQVEYSEGREASVALATSAEENAIMSLANGELQHRCRELSAMLSMSEAQKQTLEAHRSELQQRVESLTSEMKAVTQGRASMVKEIATLTHEVEILRTKVPFLEGELRHANTNNKAARDRSDAVDKLTKDVERISTERNNLIDEVSTLRQLSEAKDNQVHSLSKDVHELESLLLEETEASQRHLLVAFIEGQLFAVYKSAYRSMMRARQLQVSRLFDKEHSMTDEQKRVLAAEEQRRQEVITEGVCDLHEAEMNLLSTHLRQMENRVTDINKENSDMKQQIEKLRQALDGARTQAEELIAQNSHVFSRLSESETSLAEARDECRQATAALQVLETAQQSEQQRRMMAQATDVDVEYLKFSLTDLEQENKFVHEVNRSMTQRYESIVARLRDEQRNVAHKMEAEIERLERNQRALSDEWRCERESLEEDKTVLEETVRRMRRELTEIRRAFTEDVNERDGREREKAGTAVGSLWERDLNTYPPHRTVLQGEGSENTKTIIVSPKMKGVLT